MAIGVVLRMDEETSSSLMRIWQALEDAGIDNDAFRLGYPPHLTLAVWPDARTPDVADIDSLREVRAIALRLEGFGRFDVERPVIWLRPSHSPSLAAVQKQVVRSHAGLLRPGHFEPGNWVPHVTLFQGSAEDMEAAMSVVEKTWAGPLQARLHRLEVVRFPPVTVVGGFDLAAN